MRWLKAGRAEKKANPENALFALLSLSFRLVARDFRLPWVFFVLLVRYFFEVDLSLHLSLRNKFAELFFSLVAQSTRSRALRSDSEKDSCA